MPSTSYKKYKHILTGRPTRKRPAMHKRHVKGGGKSYATIVPTFLHMLNTVKLYHWKTTSFATHKATDELYGSLNSKIDEFVEVMLGKRELGGRKLLNGSMATLTVYSTNEAFRKQVESYKTFLLNLNDLGDRHPDLLAIRDEIMGAFNQMLYLLSLGG
jgi:hypothetical protein